MSEITASRESSLRCELCPHRCLLREGRFGVCGSRTLQGKINVHRNPEGVSALALDPIEKKPLARFRPGCKILSIGGLGCNLRCPWCQNEDIARPECGRDGQWPRLNHMDSAELIQRALDLRPQGNCGLAFTYNEPLLNVEHITETFRQARAVGLETVLVSNGCFYPPVIETLAPLTSAWNIDLKTFNPQRYREIGGDLEVVKAAITIAREHSHVEVTTLVVPGWNDSPEEMAAASSWLAGLDDSIPLHLSRFFPHGSFSDRPPTEPGTLFALGKIAAEYLRDIHYGNI